MGGGGGQIAACLISKKPLYRKGAREAVSGGAQRQSAGICCQTCECSAGLHSGLEPHPAWTRRGSSPRHPLSCCPACLGPAALPALSCVACSSCSSSAPVSMQQREPCHHPVLRILKCRPSSPMTNDPWHAKACDRPLSEAKLVDALRCSQLDYSCHYHHSLRGGSKGQLTVWLQICSGRCTFLRLIDNADVSVYLKVRDTTCTGSYNTKYFTQNVYSMC